MGADYGWQVNKIFFLHMTEEQFQIQSVEALENKSKPNKKTPILKKEAAINILVNISIRTYGRVSKSGIAGHGGSSILPDVTKLLFCVVVAKCFSIKSFYFIPLIILGTV